MQYNQDDYTDWYLPRSASRQQPLMPYNRLPYVVRVCELIMSPLLVRPEEYPALDKILTHYPARNRRMAQRLVSDFYRQEMLACEFHRRLALAMTIDPFNLD